jgi:hypothetical protein
MQGIWSSFNVELEQFPSFQGIKNLQVKSFFQGPDLAGKAAPGIGV